MERDRAEATAEAEAIAEMLAQLSILSRRMADARRRGRRKNRRPGAGAELLDTRPYVVGDDPRRIAWSAYARLERLVVRLAADEAPLRLALVLDTSASMRFGAPTKLRQATRIAAGLAAVALSGEDRVAAVASSSRGVASLRAGGGRAGMAKLFAMLDGLGADGETDRYKFPVEIEDKGQIEDPRVAMAIMLDRSGSMGAMVGTHTKLSLAVEAALAAAATLRSDDLLALGSVDEETH